MKLIKNSITTIKYFIPKQKISQFSFYSTSSNNSNNNVLNVPNQVLYGTDKLSSIMKWRGDKDIGPSLENKDNTCYLNSVLQCLGYCPPFINYLESIANDNNVKGEERGELLVNLKNHYLKDCKQSNIKLVNPSNIASTIFKSSSSRFTPGFQEDSHDLYNYLIDTLQQDYLNKQHPNIKEGSRESMTSPIASIFGGYFNDIIKCSKCDNETTKFDPFFDISLGIDQSNKSGNSIIDCLMNYTKPEILDGENKYHCSNCRAKVEAEKKTTINIAPPVLTLLLKRYIFSNSDLLKINKPVSFNQELNLSPFMTKSNNHSNYDLFAVLVHEGTLDNGHNHCFVKTSNGSWYKMDDTNVTKVTWEEVSKSNVYMLFYTKKNVESSINSNTVTTN